VQPRIHVITLGVRDLEAALKFYRDGLGLTSPGIIGTEFEGDETQPAGAVAMFQLEGGLILAVYPRTELAKDAHIPLGLPSSGEVSIGHAVPNKADVRHSPRTSPTSGRHPHPRGPRPPLGHLLGLLPRPRRTPVGSHVEPATRGLTKIVTASDEACR
jgi:catechol 2,3-dioxygenase-like lactoylglutathione lyase family enzyme